MAGPQLPLVVAHRGASAERAEHTLEAYQLAVAQGADAFECDIRVTRDGSLVCVHDRTIGRTSSGRGAVSALNAQQLDRYDWGGWHAGSGGSAELLRFSTLLDFLEAHPGKKAFVETKHPVRFGGLVEEKLVAELQRRGLSRPESMAASPIVMMSFSVLAVRRIAIRAPRLPTVLLRESRSRWIAGAAGRAQAGCIGPSIEYLRARPEAVDAWSAAGLGTYVWTVNDAASAVLARDLGVYAVASDHPRRVRQWMLEHTG